MRLRHPGAFKVVCAIPMKSKEATMGQTSGNPSSEPPCHLQAWLFGPFRVLRDGAEVTDLVGGRASARTLLKWFLLNRGHSFSGVELCDVLWAGQSHTKRINELHVTLHYLRRVLEPDLSGRCPSRFIRTEAGRYWFDPADCWWVDIDEIRLLWESARASSERGANDAAIASLQRLLDYYSQGFLPEELYVDAFADFRDAHDRGHDEALHALLELCGAMGRQYEVLACAQLILDRRPYSESALAALVEAHLQQGNHASAISELDRFVRVLDEDLGVRPGPHLVALQERVCRSRVRGSRVA